MSAKMDSKTSNRRTEVQGVEIKQPKPAFEAVFEVSLGTTREQPDLEEFLAELAISLWLAKEQEQKAA